MQNLPMTDDRKSPRASMDDVVKECEQLVVKATQTGVMVLEGGGGWWSGTFCVVESL